MEAADAGAIHGGDLMFAVSDRPAPPARIALALLGLACVLPFLSPVFYPPIASFYGEAVAFALGLAAIALMATRSLWTGVRLPRIGLMFLGFAVLMVLQIALGKGIYSQLNLLGALYVLWAAALAMLANRLVQIFGASTFAAVLAWFLLVGTVISALIGLVQLFGVHTPLTPLMLPQMHGRTYANTGSRTIWRAIFVSVLRRPVIYGARVVWELFWLYRCAPCCLLFWRHPDRALCGFMLRHSSYSPR